MKPIIIRYGLDLGDILTLVFKPHMEFICGIYYYSSNEYHGVTIEKVDFHIFVIYHLEFLGAQSVRFTTSDVLWSSCLTLDEKNQAVGLIP